MKDRYAMRALALLLVVASISKAKAQPLPTDGGVLIDGVFSRELAWSEAVGAGLRAAIASATRVDVFRIGQARMEGRRSSTAREVFREGEWTRDVLGRTRGTGKGILSYPVTKLGDTGPTILARLRDLLAGARYGSYTKFCGEIEPGVGYRFHAPRSEPVELLVCFKCGEADVVMADELERLQIDKVRAPLLELALESFPDDPELLEARRRLEERGH